MKPQAPRPQLCSPRFVINNNVLANQLHNRFGYYSISPLEITASDHSEASLRSPPWRLRSFPGWSPSVLLCRRMTQLLAASLQRSLFSFFAICGTEMRMMTARSLNEEDIVFFLIVTNVIVAGFFFS